MYIEKAGSGKVGHWRAKLLEYDFTIVHIPGKENLVADYLSRCLLTMVKPSSSTATTVTVEPVVDQGGHLPMRNGIPVNLGNRLIRKHRLNAVPSAENVTPVENNEVHDEDDEEETPAPAEDDLMAQMLGTSRPTARLTDGQLN